MSKNKNNNARQNAESTPQADDLSNVEIDDILDNIDEEEGETPKHAEDATVLDEVNIVENLQNELNTTKEQLEKEKKEYLFLMAEFDNFRKRNARERADLIKNASENVMKDLLPVVDDMERGLAAAETSGDAEAVRQGLELIHNKLLKMMEKYGVKPIDSTGKAFDPDTQEAIAMIPAPDDDTKGKVIDTPTKGYTINDKVLRHAKVVVGQ